MAKIIRYKKSNRGKEIHCMKCGKPILPGMFYLKAEPYQGPAIIRCESCGLKGYETSGSYYIQQIGDLVENWMDNYGDMQTACEEIISELENIKDELESNLDNIPEQLQDGAAGSLLQERIEEIEGVISELEYVDYESICDEAREEAEREIGEFDPEDPDCDYQTEEEWEQAVNEAMNTDDMMSDAINDALSSLTY